MNHLVQYSDEALKDELDRRNKERHDNFIAGLDTVTIDEYIECYETGYEWLTKGLNFVHPLGKYVHSNGYVLKGYIPGGPIYFNKYEKYRNPKEYANENILNNHKHKRWIQGFIDGINTFVRDNNLDYPQINT